MHRRWQKGLLVLFAIWLAGSANAQIVLPAGSSLSLNGGRVLLAGVDVDLAGQLSLGSGELLDVGRVLVRAGAALSLGSGRLQLAGDWSNQGSVDAAQGQVEFIDGRLPATASLLGTTSFFNFSMISATGKRYRFETGRTQSVGGLLTLRGDGPSLQIDTTAGPLAFLRLAPAPAGSQAISNVGVSNVHATGQALAPTQSNRGGSGNDTGWFGNLGQVVLPLVIPAGSWLSAALLGLVLIVAGGLTLRQRPS